MATSARLGIGRRRCGSSIADASLIAPPLSPSPLWGKGRGGVRHRRCVLTFSTGEMPGLAILRACEVGGVGYVAACATQTFSTRVPPTQPSPTRGEGFYMFGLRGCERATNPEGTGFRRQCNFQQPAPALPHNG